MSEGLIRSLVWPSINWVSVELWTSLSLICKMGVRVLHLHAIERIEGLVFACVKGLGKLYGAVRTLRIMGILFPNYTKDSRRSLRDHGPPSFCGQHSASYTDVHRNVGPRSAPALLLDVSACPGLGPAPPWGRENGAVGGAECGVLSGGGVSQQDPGTGVEGAPRVAPRLGGAKKPLPSAPFLNLVSSGQ